MKRTFYKLSSILLALALLLSLSATAGAADASITFKGAQEGFEVQPGSEYTATDLFDNFKDVMPGDRLTQTVHIQNAAEDCDYINLYMRAAVHHQEENPLSDKVAQTETLATMEDFLSKLTMRVYNGDQLIYDASPDTAGALVENVPLGTLHTGETLTLRVELDIPMDLGNEYANRVGEVDWIFLAECIEFQKLTVHKIWDDNGYPDRPDSVTVHLLKDGEKFEKVQLNEENQWTHTWDELDDRHQWSVEEEVPQGYEATYKTEDNRVFITNHKDYTPVIPPEPVDLTVKKVWDDENNRQKIRPTSVTVTLYNGDKAVDKVTLSKANNWTHTWKDLDGSGKWSVLETGIPKGYTPSCRTAGSVVTVTNTAALIQTGQLNWPIPVLGSLGALMLFFGIVMLLKRKKTNNA